jgi:hypothetical protein
VSLPGFDRGWGERELRGPEGKHRAPPRGGQGDEHRGEDARFGRGELECTRPAQRAPAPHGTRVFQNSYSFVLFNTFSGNSKPFTNRFPTCLLSKMVVSVLRLNPTAYFRHTYAYSPLLRILCATLTFIEPLLRILYACEHREYCEGVLKSLRRLMSFEMHSYDSMGKRRATRTASS